MVPENVTAESIVSLDSDVIASAPEIGQSEVIDELYFSLQTEVEEEENDDDDENSIKANQGSIKSKKSHQDQKLNLLLMF